MKRTAVDLFCGCGGLSLGLQEGGFDVLAGFDGWNHAVETYRANFNDHEGNLLDLGDEDLAVDTIRAYKPFLIAGGPPCQDFSSAGKREEGSRADLTVKYANIVTRVGVPAFIMENVSRAQHSQAFNEAIRVFRRAGYGLTLKVLNASLCGVPQIRKRLFLIGMLGEQDDFLASSIESSLAAEPMTIRRYDPDLVGFDYYYRHPRSYQRKAIFSIDEPSSTIRGVNRPKPATYKMHPNDSCDPANDAVQALSLDQRARIQTFPAGWFDLKLPKASKEQMVGNAVPPVLARFVAERLSAHIEKVWQGANDYDDIREVLRKRDQLVELVLPVMAEGEHPADREPLMVTNFVRTVMGLERIPEGTKSSVLAFSARQAVARVSEEDDEESPERIDEEAVVPEVEDELVGEREAA